MANADTATTGWMVELRGAATSENRFTVIAENQEQARCFVSERLRISREHCKDTDRSRDARPRTRGGTSQENELGCDRGRTRTIIYAAPATATRCLAMPVNRPAPPHARVAIAP